MELTWGPALIEYHKKMLKMGFVMFIDPAARNI